MMTRRQLKAINRRKSVVRKLRAKRQAKRQEEKAKFLAGKVS